MGGGFGVLEKGLVEVGLVVVVEVAEGRFGVGHRCWFCWVTH